MLVDQLPGSAWRRSGLGRRLLRPRTPPRPSARALSSGALHTAAVSCPPTPAALRSRGRRHPAPRGLLTGEPAAGRRAGGQRGPGVVRRGTGQAAGRGDHDLGGGRSSGGKPSRRHRSRTPVALIVGAARVDASPRARPPAKQPEPASSARPSASCVLSRVDRSRSTATAPAPRVRRARRAARGAAVHDHRYAGRRDHRAKRDPSRRPPTRRQGPQPARRWVPVRRARPAPTARRAGADGRHRAPGRRRRPRAPPAPRRASGEVPHGAVVVQQPAAEPQLEAGGQRPRSGAPAP